MDKIQPENWEKKKLLKSISGYSKTQKEKKKSGMDHLAIRGGGTLVVRPLKIHFLCVSSLTDCPSDQKTCLFIGWV